MPDAIIDKLFKSVAEVLKFNAWKKRLLRVNSWRVNELRVANALVMSALRVWRYSLFLALLGTAGDINAVSFEAVGNCRRSKSQEKSTIQNYVNYELEKKIKKKRENTKKFK